jgi:hypothetical protein
MQLQPHTATDERGVERCMTIKEAAIENVKGDPSKGYHYAKAYCNQPMALSVSEKRKICPSCYKEPVVGFPTPRTTNANGVVLSPKEMEECGLNPDGTRIDGKPIAVSVPHKLIEAPQAVEAKVVKKDEVSITVTLNELAEGEDIAALLIRRVIDGMDNLPVTNFGESKRLIKLQEKLQSLLGA